MLLRKHLGRAPLGHWSPLWTPVIAGLVAVGATGGMAVSAVWQLTGQPAAAAAPGGAGDSPPLFPELPATVDIPETGPVPLRDGTAQERPGGGAPGLPTVQGIPGRVLAAYQHAVDVLADAQPGCRLTTPLLSAIGRVESGHARGGDVDSHGRTRTPILGPRLDGGPGVKAIRDTDNGGYDGDRGWDRAVGPMQFIPTTWNRWGADGNGDGVADPHNVDDAALAAGRYLCAAGGNLSEPAGLRRAVLAYNRSEPYLNLVLAWMRTYSGNTVPLDNPRRPSSADEPRPAQEPRPSEERRPPPESPSPSPKQPPDQQEPDDPDPLLDPSVPVTGMGTAAHQDLNTHP